MKGHIFLLIRLLEISSTLQELPTYFFFFLHFSSITEGAFVSLFVCLFSLFSTEVIIETSNNFDPFLVEKSFYKIKINTLVNETDDQTSSVLEVGE